MIEYNLEDKEGNVFELNGSAIPVIPRKSGTIESEQFGIDSRTEENSFLSGKVKIGENRLLSRTLPYSFQVASTEDSAFNLILNSILFQLNKVNYLIDVTNDKRIKVNLIDFSIINDTGSHKRSADVSFNLDCLKPYWEDNTEQTISGSTVAATWKEITFNNDGYIELYPEISLSASAQCDYVEAVMETQSIRVEDPLFGTIAYEIMDISNEEGYVKLGATDITSSITAGLGFISVPVGSFILNLLTEIVCDYTITYRRRYFV